MTTHRHGLFFLYSPLDSNTSNAAFLKRFDMDGDQLNSWRIKVTESMIKGDFVLVILPHLYLFSFIVSCYSWLYHMFDEKSLQNFPRRISKRFLIHNSCYMKVIDQEFGVHFQCNLKSSSRDLHESLFLKVGMILLEPKKLSRVIS